MTKLRVEIEALLEAVDLATVTDMDCQVIEIPWEEWSIIRHDVLAVKQRLDKGETDASHETR